MFLQSGKLCLFVELARHFDSRPHTRMECIPLPVEVAESAPIYFKKAISEAGSEWSDNPKLVDTKGKGIRRSIPEGFPYLHVEFSLKVCVSTKRKKTS